MKQKEQKISFVLHDLRCFGMAVCMLLVCGILAGCSTINEELSVLLFGRTEYENRTYPIATAQSDDALLTAQATPEPESASASALEQGQVPQETLVPQEGSASAAIPMPKPDTSSLWNYREEYALLNAPEQEVYRAIVECLLAKEEEVKISADRMDVLSDIFYKVLSDFPEIFYTERFQARLINNKPVAFLPVYTAKEAEITAQQQALEGQTAAFLQTMPRGMNAYETIQYVYEYVVLHVTYQASAQDQNIYGALVEHKSVCAGYANSMDYFLRILGVPCRTVTGVARNEMGMEDHAWNVVQIGSEWYYVDATWGDHFESIGENQVDYEYLCITSDEIGQTHTLNETQNVPLCTATTYNYYRMAGLYLEAYDYDTVKELIVRQYTAGKLVQMKCASKAIYEELVAQLIDNNLVYQMLEENGTPVDGCSYSQSTEQWILTLMF